METLVLCIALVPAPKVALSIGPSVRCGSMRDGAPLESLFISRIVHEGIDAILLKIGFALSAASALIGLRF